MLDETYIRRAVPPGSARHLSWLFAPGEARGPLLACFALQAEWRALSDPQTDPGVAATKLAWWQEEMRRLAARRPVHPISRCLAALPRAALIDFTPLSDGVTAALAELAGTPVERGDDLHAHAAALHGACLLVAARLSAGASDPDPAPSVRALAVAEYLARALAGYRTSAPHGRIPFAIDELLAAGISNSDLCSADPPPVLQAYLASVRSRSADQYLLAAALLPRAQRPRQRALLVLADLGRRHVLCGVAPRAGAVRLQDVYWAWRAARRAARAS